jgi:hypothetical protein
MVVNGAANAGLLSGTNGVVRQRKIIRIRRNITSASSEKKTETTFLE